MFSRNFYFLSSLSVPPFTWLYKLSADVMLGQPDKNPELRGTGAGGA